MSIPNLTDNPLLSRSTFRSHHRLDASILQPRRTNWASILQNTTADEVESLEKTEEDSDDDDDIENSSKIYYKKLLKCKNKAILKLESNNDGLRMLFKGVVEHQERCQVLETSVKNIQQNEIDLHETYIEELEGKVNSLKTKYQTEKLLNETKQTKMDELTNKNLTMKKQIQCVICHSEERNTIFYPCNHVSCCDHCANNLYNLKCPTCRSDIQEKKIIYLS
tara:strand:- start:4005 stop:4670 length:666 start_codon:yes stop_codon:yes gene_type:complete